MAGKTIKGITIEIGAETKGLSDALSDVSKKSKDIQKELRQVDRLLRFNPKNTELLAQKQKLLGEQVSVTKERLDKLKAAEAQVQEQFKKGEISEQQYRDFQREIVETESKLKHYESQLKEVSKAHSELGEKMQEVGNGMKDVGKKVSDVGGDMTKKITLPLTGVGAAASKLGIEFEKGMSEVAAVSGATGDELEQLEKAAREAGATTDKSARDAADALQYMALAGWDVEDSQKALMPVLKLSSAANMDLGRTSDLVTDTMSVLGLEINDLDGYLDVLAQTSRNSNTDVDQLGEAFLVVGGKLTQLGVDVEEGAVALGLLADNGIKGSEAGRGLNAILTNLTAPTGQAKKALEELNISAFDSNGEFIGLEETLQLVQDKTADMTQEQQNMYYSMVAGKEHSKTLNALMSELGDGFGSLSEDVEGADGALDEMYDTATNNTMGAINNLKSALEELSLKIFDSLQPTIEKLVDWVQKITDKFNALSPETQDNIVKIGLLAAAIGPAILIIGKLISATGSIIGVFGKLVPIAKGVGLVIGGLSAPVAIAIGAIAGAIAIGVALWKNWDTVKQKASQLGSFLSSKFKQIGDFISKPFKAAADFVGRQVQRIKDFFSKLKLKIPKPKVPKFELTGEFNLMPPSVPRIKVKWNAKGGLMDGATLFGAKGNTLLGGGEAGKEGLVPLEGRHMYPLADAIADRLNNAQGGQVIVENMYVRDDTDIHLISKELFNLNKQAQRAKGRK